MAEKARSESKTDEFLSTMRSKLAIAINAYDDSRQDELDDLKFFAATPDNQWQWPQSVLSVRTANQGQGIVQRPSLTINKLPQHVRQITNDQRQNRPAGKVIPANDEADLEMAEILEGMVRHIEVISDADVAVDTACENQVTFGEGYIRIVTEYCDDDSFDQDIKIKRVRNSFSVFMDPHIDDPCGADAEWCFITEDIPHDEYERQWPDAKTVSSIKDMVGSGDKNLESWCADKTIRIAEYFYVDFDRVKLNLYPGNQIAYSGTPEDDTLKTTYGKPVRSRDVDKRQVKWVKTNGYEILEEQDWAGRWIPVVRIVGNEFEVDGQVFVSGIIRNAKDAQRMYNYWVSQEAEMLALAPKAPFVGYAGQFEGFENKWKTANTVAYPYLEVNPNVTDGQGRVLPLPQRALPPAAQDGLIRAKVGASEDIKDATGQYNATLGQVSNERSGKAIMARERQADIGTYHFPDNLARGIRYVTRQVVDLIPKIYDTNRIARIVGLDGETKMVKIDPAQQEAVRKVMDENGQVLEKIYNPSVGKYDVTVTTGPSYMTKRQEARDSMSELLQGNPELWKVAGDLFIKNMDWPGAEQMAKRLAKSIDPKLLEDSDDSPALVAAKQQIQAMGQEMEHMHQMLQNVSKSIEMQEIEIKEAETAIKAYDAMTKRLSAVEANMSPDQIQQIVLGTVHGMITSGDLMGQMPEIEMGEEPPGQGEMQQMPPGGVPMGQPPQPSMNGE